MAACSWARARCSFLLSADASSLFAVRSLIASASGLCFKMFCCTPFDLAMALGGGIGATPGSIIWPGREIFIGGGGADAAAAAAEIATGAASMGAEAALIAAPPRGGGGGGAGGAVGASITKPFAS